MSRAPSRYVHGTGPEEQWRLSRLNDLLNGAALSALDAWARRPDAALWFAVSWAEGTRPA